MVNLGNNMSILAGAGVVTAAHQWCPVQVNNLGVTAGSFTGAVFAPELFAKLVGERHADKARLISGLLLIGTGFALCSYDQVLELGGNGVDTGFGLGLAGAAKVVDYLVGRPSLKGRVAQPQATKKTE